MILLCSGKVWDDKASCCPYAEILAEGLEHYLVWLGEAEFGCVGLG
jgi:hypothetical protein